MSYVEHNRDYPDESPIGGSTTMDETEGSLGSIIDDPGIGRKSASEMDTEI